MKIVALLNLKQSIFNPKNREIGVGIHEYMDEYGFFWVF